MSAAEQRVVVAGEPLPTGAYLLRIRLRSVCDVAFGRLNQGRPLSLPAGDYIYVGSAMGLRGSATLANRLLRHGRRSGSMPPHSVLGELRNTFIVNGLWDEKSRPPSPKQLRWHVDYLLDQRDATISQVFIVYSAHRIEARLANQILADPATHIMVAGLGASDAPGSTHLLHVSADEQWWRSLPMRLAVLAGPGGWYTRDSQN